MYWVLVGKCEGTGPHGRPRHRKEGIIIMDCKEIRWGVMNWIYVVQDREMWQTVPNMVTIFRVP